MPNEGSYEAALRRSNEIQADLPEHAGKYNMLTGDRPTGRLHLGHYFGTIVERVRLQNLGVHTNIIIADYQVITMSTIWLLIIWPAELIQRKP